MSNPAPTLNQINAFNATQGTTIDFNIIGGTEVIRSNKIYIYDLSDNSLICTHLYVSTESIHELPPNTSSSIVYASGKSSADFTNNTQYYAQIQTFTDVGGTQGGSGLSIAKLFWCLPTPTLTLSTIPTTISTTSYNVSATYTSNTSGNVTNDVQQFQFNLYSAIGTLLQTSGVVLYGEGVDLSYNFSGLEVDGTYYVTLDVTTTQGMNVSAQSNTFTVSIDTPTMGSASVVNNGCDGYISVTSNLSSEYKHEESVDSGEIMSFTTESLNDIVKLVVNINPLQDLHGYDKPWVGGAGKNKVNDGLKCVLGNQVFIGFDTYALATSVSCVLPAGTYTFSVETYDGINPAALYVAEKGTQDAFAENYQQKALTFTIAQTTEVRAWAYKSGYGDVGVSAITYAQIEEGSTATSYAPYENLCPITGWTGCDINKYGKNLFDDVYSHYSHPVDYRIRAIDLPNGNYALKATKIGQTVTGCAVGITKYGDKYTDFDQYLVLNSSGDVYNRTLTVDDTWTSPKLTFYCADEATFNSVFENYQIQLEFGSTATSYEPYNTDSHVYPVSWQTEAGTVYGGTVDVVSGVLTVTKKLTTITSFEGSFGATSHGYAVYKSLSNRRESRDTISNMFLVSSYGVDNMPLGSYQGDSGAVTTWTFILPSTITSLAEANAWLANLSEPLVVTENLATPTTYQLTGEQIDCLLGQNNVWNNINGGMSIIYQLPITDLLVKRKDVADVSGKWLTLYSTPITQASDMDFTFIDFLNQYGKTYQYALVPVLAQDQSGVIVKIEGGYTVSDNVDSIFDGVYIADQTNVERVKAGVGYGNIDMNQGVGSITPIGSKYPIVITNSQNQYHNGSIRGTIVPNDFYSNGNLSRIDMVNKRDELEQFLTNKRAKIIKDWNGKMWLVMIMSNVSCSFDDNYGMGMVSFSADWLEVGDPTNQQDLYNAGLINVGGV